MNSRHRPPLILSDPEPEHGTPQTDTAAPEPADLGTAIDSAWDLDVPVDRPISERRRRQMLQAREDAIARQVAGEPPQTVPAPVAPSAALTAAKGAVDPGPSPYPIAMVATVLWMAAVGAFVALETSGADAVDPLRLIVYGLAALAPVGLIFLLAQAVRQGQRLVGETRRASHQTDLLVAPTALAAQEAGGVLATLRGDISQVTLASERARSDLILLREALAEETARLNAAAETAGRTARRLVEHLGQERGHMQALGETLDAQATGVIDAVERQSRMVAEASSLSQAQLREAEAALAARAADLAAAAGEAQDAARLAADDLSRQTLRLENAGTGVADQIRSVEDGLGQQRAALVAAAYALREDQEDFSAQVESQRAQLNEQLSAARGAANDLDQASVASSEKLRGVVEAATDQFHALVEMSQREADGFDSATKVALDRFEALAAEARDGLMEETRHTLAALQATADASRASAMEAAGQAQIRVDRLGEALFEAAQKADQAADARVEEARRIVGQTADLVDEAGERALQRLEATLARVNQAVAQMDQAMGDLETRTARLPEEAQARADAVRTTVEQGLAALSDASRRAAQDTEALDATFQQRVRRNYDLLTEAYQLIGGVSAEGAAPQRRASSDSPPRPRPADPVPAPAPASEPRFGLRGRVAPEARPAPSPTPPSSDEGLGWDDLIGDDRPEEPMVLDRPVNAAEADTLAGPMVEAIRRIGVDPNALLPRSRVDEVAAAIAADQADQGRAVVRRVAPAAVRSVSRRTLGDPQLRTDVERFVGAYGQKLGALARDGDGAGVRDALATDAGRAFLLLDAAVGDLN